MQSYIIDVDISNTVAHFTYMNPLFECEKKIISCLLHYALAHIHYITYCWNLANLKGYSGISSRMAWRQDILHPTCWAAVSVHSRTPLAT